MRVSHIGAAIPFGRSLTYRFAMAAFWAGVAVAEVDLAPPLDNLGTVKGLLLRNLRWWSSQSATFNSDGTLSIGYSYPNMYMSEDYNSPQSVYWCLKSFTALLLPENHHFWTCKELPHPLEAAIPAELKPVGVIEPIGHIISNTREHHFLLSSGQMTTRQFKAREAKYGKFAYSSAFAFSVPSGFALHQIAPDSTLCASIDGGETWKTRWSPIETRVESFLVDPLRSATGAVPSLVSIWKPWSYLDVTVESRLIPAMELFPGWHVRLHRVKWRGLESTAPWARRLILVDGGFAICSDSQAGYFIPEVASAAAATEGWSISGGGCLVRSSAGASGVFDITSSVEKPCRSKARVEVSCLRADPNTNISSQRTFIPVSRVEVTLSSADDECSGDLWMATAIFAVSSHAQYSSEEIGDMWSKVPRVTVPDIQI